MILCAILKAGPVRNVLSHNPGWYTARPYNWGLLCCSRIDSHFRGLKSGLQGKEFTRG